MRRARDRFLGVLAPIDLTEHEAMFDAWLRSIVAFNTTVAQPVVQKPLALSWWDWTVFLLHTAAEIEHSLMIQYLYAAYSLFDGPYRGTPPANATQLARKWRRLVLGIAREEMGHLLTVQNLLHFIGAPLNFEREDFPYRQLLYPFHFTHEPLTKDALAKYVIAEMPANPADDLCEIKERASAAEGAAVNRVGLLYALLAEIFADPTKLGDADLLADTADNIQARSEDWMGSSIILVRRIASREQAHDALRAIGEQGEGPWNPPAGAMPSHYDRFLGIYREYPETEPSNPQFAWAPTRPVPVNPVTGRGGARTAQITHPTTVLWAELANVRYRMLLTSLAHGLRLPGPVGSAENKTPKGRIRDWAFEEMKGRNLAGLRALAQKLTLLPLREDTSVEVVCAGIPFELPYSLLLHEDNRQRWRQHLAILDSSATLLQALRDAGQTDPILDEFAVIDADRRSFIHSMA